MRQRSYLSYPLVNDFQANPTLIINGKPTKPYDPAKGHTGIDVGCLYGTPLHLPIILKCVGAWFGKEMGNCVAMEDPQKNVLVSSHLSEVFAKEGVTYPVDFIFAKTGNTGSVSTNPHWHFEIIAKTAQKGFEIMTRTLIAFTGYNIDPVPYLDELFKNPILTDLDWCKKHLPEISEEYWKRKFNTEPEFLTLLRMLSHRIVHEWRKEDDKNI